MSICYICYCAHLACPQCHTLQAASYVRKVRNSIVTRQVGAVHGVCVLLVRRLAGKVQARVCVWHAPRRLDATEPPFAESWRVGG
jgi:hypothetical protein